MADSRPTPEGRGVSSHSKRHRLEPRLPRKIRFTSAEWQAVVECAQACGKPPAEYVRETSLGSVPKVRHGQANEALIRELGRIGTALTRLAATAKETGTAEQAATLESALAGLLAVVRRLG
jgi:hypothetical protein